MLTQLILLRLIVQSHHKANKLFRYSLTSRSSIILLRMPVSVISMTFYSIKRRSGLTAATKRCLFGDRQAATTLIKQSQWRLRLRFGSCSEGVVYSRLFAMQITANDTLTIVSSYKPRRIGPMFYIVFMPQFVTSTSKEV